MTTGGYVFVQDVAQGGMGKVELVVRRDGRFARVYARKRLHEAFAGDPEVRAMFLDEARIAGLVRHVHAVAVHDVGTDARGPYLVMDWVEGMAASAIAQETARAGRRLPLQVAVSIVRQAAEGLHAAHELVGSGGRALAVVHRDVSPQNVLVGFDGVVRVTDFGVARALDQDARTSAGVLKGKFGYMSPEQLRFEPLDRRADLFSLGVVLYELAAGARLYSGERESVFRRILEAPAPDLGEARPDAPPALVELAFELLAKDRAHRPATARAVAQRLDAIGSGLAAGEGPLDLAEWLGATFAAERERERALVARAMETASSGAEAKATVVDRPAARRGRRRIVAVAAVGAVAVAIGIGFFALGGSADPAAPAAAAASVPVFVPPPAAPTTAPVAASAAAASAEPVEARRRRRPGPRKDGGAGVPSWNWEER